MKVYRILPTAVLVVLLVAGLLGSGCSQALVAVPRLQGMSELEAEALLQEKGLRLDSRAQDHSQGVQTGKVIWTDPGSGTELKKGSGVNIVVSTGPDAVCVPDLRGAAETDASAVLGSLGLFVNISRAYSETVDNGAVVSVEPAPGTLNPKGNPVNLTVSMGSAYITCPNCGGDGKIVTYTACPECEGTGVCYS
jgi:serine/threonine-protein kinase